ncbi:MAG: hypothetical protein FWC41_09575 [Firmicutes bacterium]|nr:hypothetical protein [Bacillota bacterium]
MTENKVTIEDAKNWVKIKKCFNNIPFDATCAYCEKEIDHNNMYSEAGFRELRITGMCERCFDAACGKPYGGEVYD